MQSLTEVLATIDARIAAIDTERAELVSARAVLARTFGAPAPETTSHPAPKAGRQARPPAAGAPADLLPFLSTPRSTSQIGQHLGLASWSAVWQRLQPLLAAGTVTKTGAGPATRYRAT